MYILWEIIKFILNVLAITTIVDIILMGPLLIHFEKKAKHAEFFVRPRLETVNPFLGFPLSKQEGEPMIIRVLPLQRYPCDRTAFYLYSTRLHP